MLTDAKLTTASILLFGKEPQRFFLQSQVRCARFKGIESTDFIDMKDIDGSVIDQVEEVMKFIQRHISLSAKVISGRIQREEVWEYPSDALREAITNAICHRDYSDPGNVQVRIFDDRVEVWNPGHLPNSISLEDLKREHSSFPRNKLIAQAFYLIGFMERWGTGTVKMIKSCKEAGLPEPEFHQDRSVFRVILRKSVLTEEYLRMSGLNDRQIKAVRYAQQNRKITNKEFVALTGVSRQTATRDLKQLEEKRVFISRGYGKGSYFAINESIMGQS